MKKIICILISLCIGIMCCSCTKQAEKPGPSGPIEPDKPTAPIVEGSYLVNNGISKYNILIEEDATSIVLKAAGELSNFFIEATGIVLPIIKESEYTGEQKVISLGNTQLLKSLNLSKITNTQGFKIVTHNDDIVISGGGDWGVLWGVYELLGRLFNYEYYAASIYTLDKEVKELPLYLFDIADQPDIETRAIADSQGYNNMEVAHRMRQIKADDSFFLPTAIGTYHNSFAYLQDENGDIDERFLSTGGGLQLCYTARGNEEDLDEMLDTALEYLISVTEKSSLNDVMFGMQDTSGHWCQCSACKASKAQYGADLAAVIKFANELHRRLESYFEENVIDRHVNIYVFAYNDISMPPVTKDANGNYIPTDPSVVCDEGVGIFYAPAWIDYTKSIKDKANATYYEYLKQFNALTDRLLVWTYATNFTWFLVPYDSISYMPELFKTLVENGATYIFNQGKHNQGNSSCFDVLRQYLVSKIAWDVDANVEVLTNNFFQAYFGVAAEPMRGFYEELRSLLSYNYAVKGMSGGIYGSIYKEEFWPMQTLNNWLDYVEQAYSKILPLKVSNNKQYNTLHDNIMRESIFVRYLLLTLYHTDAENIKELQNAFIADALSVGIAKYSEGGSIGDIFK